MSKELWIEAYEELLEEYIDLGYKEAEAMKMAEEEAWDKMNDKFADAADYYRVIGRNGL